MKKEDLMELKDTGIPFSEQKQKDPSEEIFHSCYISGRKRTNELNIEERSEMLQVRGISFNLEEVNMIIMHVKDVLVNRYRDEGSKERIVCFSFNRDKGTSEKKCGKNRAERSKDSFCAPCRSELIVSGLFTDKNGKPILKENEEGENSPVFIFIRGKGVKYFPVSNYLNSLYLMETDFITDVTTSDDEDLERKILNNKKVVTNITMGKGETQHGEKDVFSFSIGKKLPKEVTLKIMELSKKHLNDFVEKMNWSGGSKDDEKDEEDGKKEEITYGKEDDDFLKDFDFEIIK